MAERAVQSERVMTGSVMHAARPERITIGGSEQWIVVRSDDLAKPVVLYLHGGPGTSQLTSNRRHTHELEKYFTVVDWDQRGAGKSFGAIKDVARMNVDQFVEDTREVTLHLLGRFQKRRIVLVGHSWGSAIGVLTAARYPELFHCYVGIGQVANMAEGEAASYRWTLEQAERAHRRRAARALAKMGPPPYTGDWRHKTITERKYVAQFGGEIHGSKIGAMGIVLRSLLFSREYDLGDRINIFRGILGSMKLLWPQLLKVNLFESVPELKIPVFILAGRFDHEVPSEIAARYVESLRAPSKELIWFERSAHMPQFEEQERFTKLMVEKVLPLAADGPVAPPPRTSSFRPEGPAPTWIAAPSGHRIPVRTYGVGGPRRPVIMLHGLQSHSGWFVQSAQHLSQNGMPVYAFDRSGSGLSETTSDTDVRLERLLAEIDAVADRAEADTGYKDVTLVGHCFGAIPALLYAALHRPDRVASLVLATPALYTLADLSPRDKARVLWSVLSGRGVRVPVPLSPEQFSDLDPYIAFVRSDTLALRTAPARLMYEVSLARRRLRRAAPALRVPLFVAYAGGDVICDNPRNRRLLARVTSPMETRTYPGARHILEFSSERDAFLSDLVGWLARERA